ncbi:DUF262 domain-containing protein [uncultured Sphingomonas sp.]|uniref:DUF262 domain-containing protein n=1 Tax=uncultured Sphingomonas sp. TaxID=158754 RepID=UPI0025E11994|nr:DUF262 domain-containing protein [uncultured Sphingomonas sp.]
MINDLRYTVRSREIVDLVAAMRNASITLSPYFQRNLVWREAHKKDFIDTILKGYPFPQIFLARGPIDLETMSASQAVVDGQQRLNAILDFVQGRLEVEGKRFRELEPRRQEEFLKYEVAVIDFDLDAGDPKLKDVFHRLNRTFYALSAIEKLASEYSASEFMLVARVLSGEILKQRPDDEFFDIEDEAESGAKADANVFSRDPGIDDESWAWLIERTEGPFSDLIRNGTIFSPFEFDRKVPLMFTLNVMSTFLLGYYERNDRVRKMLDDRSSVFVERQEVIDVLNETAGFVARMGLPKGSPWWNKANFFTLVCELARHSDLRGLNPAEAGRRLRAFGESMPDDYALAAREAVSRKPQRELRGRMVRGVIAGENGADAAK